jgi:hypothetical protein
MQCYFLAPAVLHIGRCGHEAPGVGTEKIADVIFLLALTLMTIICALITYAFV